MRISPVLLLFLSMSSGAALREARAQTPPGSEAPSVLSLSRELICPCPDCGGKSLDLCEAGCRDGQVRRDAVSAQLKAGKDREQVLQFMSATYGAQVLGEPPREGWGILSLAMPIAGLAAGAIPLMWFTKRGKSARNRGGRRSQSQRPAPIAPSEDARVAQALKDFDF